MAMPNGQKAIACVKVYSLNKLYNLDRMDLSLMEEHKGSIIEMFNRTSGFIGGHSNPSSYVNTPSLEKLKNDLDAFLEIKKKFKS